MPLEGIPNNAPTRQRKLSVFVNWRKSSGGKLSEAKYSGGKCFGAKYSGGKTSGSSLSGLLRLLAPFIALLIILPVTTSGCAPELLLDPELSKNVRIELIDWHVSGLWVINSPVCWFRVYNYNPRPITDITITYETFDFEGRSLDKGTFTLLDAGEPTVVQANSPKSCVEQYIGMVSLESDKLSCKLKGVRAKE